jgi:acetyltransferase-like isoleucine patch superfamily enzyme
VSKFHYDKTIASVGKYKDKAVKVIDNTELKKVNKSRTFNGLKAPKGRCIISVDMDYKNSHQLTEGVNIRLERDVENLNKRYTAAVNATIMYAENIPIGAEVIINHNATHDTNRIFELEDLEGDIIASEIRYFSIPEEDCYIYKEENDQEWKPCLNFALGLRVFEPYLGLLAGVNHKELKNFIYITSDCELKGQVVKTVHASLYEMVFNDSNFREKRLIRIRHSQDPDFAREEVELIAKDKTEMVKNGTLYIGLNADEAKKLN